MILRENSIVQSANNVRLFVNILTLNTELKGTANKLETVSITAGGNVGAKTSVELIPAKL